MEDDILSPIQMMADQYRSAYRMDDAAQLECRIPHHLAQEAIGRYGSLEAAADAIFYPPGRVRLIDMYWEDWCFEVQERVNERFARRRLHPVARRPASPPSRS